jgi:electron transfer flavoprotein alpha subunit
MSNILVCLELLDGEPTSTSFELLGAARSLAAALGCKVDALAIGPLAEGAIERLGAADTVLRVEDDSLTQYNPEAYARVLAATVAERDPVAVLCAYTTFGMEMAPALSVRTDRPLVSYCIGVQATDSGFEATCRLFAGKLDATVSASAGTIFSLLPGAFLDTDGSVAGSPGVETLAVVPGLDGLRTRVDARHAPDTSAVDLSSVDKIVCVGRGIGAADNISDARDLCELLGAELAGSRPVIDSGWLPKERQVGKSGTRVKPKLYLALGVSGAPEHLEGMSAAELIVAINSDSSAPIFDVAHYGAQIDLFELLPALSNALRS